MNRKTYSSDLTDAQWEVLAPLLPPANSKGHPRTVDLREVINGILYVLRGGIPWRLLPHDLPPWGTVWWYFRKWRLGGTLGGLHNTFTAPGPGMEGRGSAPTAAILNSQ